MGGGALPTFDAIMTYNTGTGQFDFDSTDNAHANTYTIEVTATLADGTSETETFDLTLNGCVINTVAQTD